MHARPLQPWITRHIAVRQRLERIGTSSPLLLMVVTTKHALHEAALFSGLHPSLFSQRLQSHSQVAITTREQLAKNAIPAVCQGTPTARRAALEDRDFDRVCPTFYTSGNSAS